MKHKNKDGISLNYTSDDIHARLVKEVILEAIDMLEEGEVLVSAGHLPEPGLGRFIRRNGRRIWQGI